MKFAHIELGPADAPALVFLHGFLGSAEDWRPVMNEFARDFRCIALDLPGHGHSAAVSSEDFAKAFSMLLEQLRITRCGLIGYSLGGRLALHFALNHSALVEFLVLESASPGIDNTHERIARREADEKWAAMMEREGLPKFLDAWYAQPVFASLRARPDLLAGIKASRLRAWSDGFQPSESTRRLKAVAPYADVLREFSPGFVSSLWPRLAEWRAPLLYIAGELDTKYCDIGKRVADLCPRASLHIVRNSGHVVHAEQPDDFVSALRAFPTIGK